MTAFRSVGARLSLAMVVVVAVALGVVYAIVVPRLERNLVEAKLDQLTRVALAEQERGRFPVPFTFDFSDPDYRFELDSYLREAAAATSARVTLYAALPDGRLRQIDPLRGRYLAPEEASPVALRSLLNRGTPERGIVRRGDERFAEVTYGVAALSEHRLLVFSAPLDETLANVQLVQRRLLVAGAIALLVAVLLGYGGALVFARRIRRLERAAERIAGGRLDEPVHDDGRDELGQLAQAFERMRQQLAQLEHARREFIANASHELRTPIFSVGGFLEVLSDEDRDDTTRAEFLTTMQEQIDRLTKLATDLLDLSRIDAGRISVERTQVHLRAVAETLAEEFAAVARTTDHGISVEGLPATALGDEQRVLQIGRILVENALLHTPAGTTLRVRIGTDSGWATLAVEDDGPGIGSEHRDPIFERFYRVDGARASGSGLGLSIARELAELMGGILIGESRPGRTVFTLRLPAAARTLVGAPTSAAA